MQPSSPSTPPTHDPTVAAGAPAMPRHVPLLWARLQQLQPTIALSRAPAKATAAAAAPHHTGMSYSFVVVPPPVPAATSAFHAHVTTLLRHVPHPTFLTCTSYSPYFASAAAAEHAAGGQEKHEQSATQEAIDFLHATMPPDTALVLTVTATRATSPGSADAAHGPATTLTGATRGGTAAVLADFEHRLASSHRSRGLMVLRGDDGGYTRVRGLATTTSTATPEDAAAATPCPYADFADGLELLRFIRDTGAAQGRETEAAVCLCIGGYPQGHVLDRHWGAPPASSSAAQEAAEAGASLPLSSPPPPPHADTLRFLADLDDVYERTEAPLRQARGGDGHADAAAQPPPADTCLAAADALFTRLDAVRRLWRTPSVYAGAARRRCTAATITVKARDGGARVVVTQMITSAAEFTAYVEDIQHTTRIAADADPADTTTASLVVVPGLMAPLRAEPFLRSTLQLKVILSAPFRLALDAYAAALQSAADALRGAVAGNTEDGAVTSAVQSYQQAKEFAEVGFQDAMVDITVDIVRELRAAGYSHVNFSAFQYGCGDAVGRVVSALATAEAGPAA